MNELFVNIKVDREERPDVDAIYMDAVQALTGRRRLADDRVPDPRRAPVLRRHVFPADAARSMPAFSEVLARVADAYSDAPRATWSAGGGALAALRAASRERPARRGAQRRDAG